MTIFREMESEVRSYCRAWPVTFTSAVGSTLTDGAGRRYLDFFAGAGALNYGHNPSVLKSALLEYIADDGITHSLDMHTAAKANFLEAFRDTVLRPRALDYRVQFPGPTGSNAVEAALKLARKATGRRSIVHFTNSFHGVTLGSLAVTGNGAKRAAAGVPLEHTKAMPFDGYPAGDPVSLRLFAQLLDDGGSGVDLPAAVIVETVQGEGGLNVARPEWMRDLAAICSRHGVLLIIDDVQMGVGRTGPFFSFEGMGFVPDIVCLSKSISGYGLPMALVLINPDFDVWRPGEHNGTFRGNNHAFVTGAAALRHFWSDDRLTRTTLAKGERVAEVLGRVTEDYAELGLRVKGRGLARGLHFGEPAFAEKVSIAAFELGLLVETSGPRDEVVKLLPSLTISDEQLDHGLDLLVQAIRRVAM